MFAMFGRSCMCRSLALVALSLLTFAPTASCQSFHHGYPWHGAGGAYDFGGMPGFGHHSRFGRQNPYGRQGDSLDDYFGRTYQRCPPYEAIKTSRWELLDDGSAHLQVTLPGVHSSNRRFTTGEDGQSFVVRAARALPARGQACLPRGAEVSADGRHEILEKTFAVPEQFDASGATIQSKGGSLVNIYVPPKKRASAGAPPAQQRATSSAKSAAGGARQPEMVRKPVPATPPARPASKKLTPQVPASPVPLPRKPANLPPSDGLEVVDEHWPAEPKSLDASEGWFDNRGEFQHY